AWSGEAMRDCSMVDKPRRFLISEAGIWGEAVRRRSPLILNDYAAVHMVKKGVPEGHVPLGRLLVVPHFSQGRICAVAAMANRSADYTQDDITQIASFLRSVDAIVQSTQAREALQQSESRFASAFDFSAIGMALVSPEGRWLKVNRAVCGMLGYTQEELLARSFQDITHPDDLEADIACVRQMLNGELQTYQMETRYYHKAGHTVWALLSVSLIWEEQGKPLHFIAQIQDITDRKQAEEAMQRLQKMQIEAEKLAATGRMAARVAHEINNPLAGIQNSFHLIRDAVPETHPDHDMVERIDREIERIANIVRQMYTLYSPRTETILDVKVADAVQDVLMMLEPLRREHGVQFDVAPFNAGLTVRITKGGLHQTLYNVVTNAVEASPWGGAVGLVAELTKDKRDAAAVRISVRDYGVGIPPELFSQVFEPLFTTKTDDGIKGGLGLGLPLVRGIVESVGGEIEFESTPGQGTVFRVLLPQGSEPWEG
ncbi:MAG: PAS domain S-box protein, partial [Patescibacteria group bacterium]|nr:PAS domain S-box protein [Patescibacteria group bacterium]